MTYAVNYFKEAIESDPSYAQAYAGLADSYSLLPEFSNAPFHDSMAKAKAASLKALELDNTLAEAHVSLAYAKVAEWDWAGVEDEYKRGLTLNPNYATGHQWYSEYLLFAGRTDEALKEITLAQQLDPLSLIINTRLGITLYYARRYDEAMAAFRKTLEFNPDFILTHVFLYGCFFEKGMHRESIPHIVKGFFNGNTPNEQERIEEALTAAYNAGGKERLWEKVRDLMQGTAKKDYNYPYLVAETNMRLGDNDEAFFWLQKAVDVKHPAVAALRVEPAMDGLRSDPRFAELLRRVNL
jgi:tetratricopeptide (TPR) repeat protein